MSMSKAVEHVLRILRERPAALWSVIRTYGLFRLTRLLWPILHPSNVRLGRNVRLQRLRSLAADGPEALVEIGDNSIIYEEAYIAAYGHAHVVVGECSILGPTRIYSRYAVRIGRRFMSSWNVFIQDFDPHPVNPDLRARQVMSIVASFKPAFGEKPKAEPFVSEFRGEPITIGDDVWVGANTTIFRGAHIGDGSIIAAGAVVLKGDYPPRSVLAGNPAKVVKTI